LEFPYAEWPCSADNDNARAEGDWADEEWADDENQIMANSDEERPAFRRDLFFPMTNDDKKVR
jgi:hypothetical protein